MSARIAEILARANHALSRRMFLVVLAGVAMGWTSPSMVGLKPAVPLLFGFMTFVTSLELSWRSVAAVAASPGTILRLFGLSHVAMPLAVLGLTHLILGRDSPYAAGLVLAACIPAAVTSVIWTGIVGGETSLSLTAVAVDSLLSPLVVPASVWLFLGRSVSMETGELFRGLVWMIVLPTMLGLTCHDLGNGRAAARVAPAAGFLSKMALMVVVAVNLAVARGTITALEQAVLPVLGLIFAQTSLAFLLGWAAARAMGCGRGRVLAFAFTVGLRNISAGAAIAIEYFPPAVGLPVILAFLLQQPTAAIFARFFQEQRPEVS